MCLSLCDDIFSQQQDETTSHSSQVHHQETKNERSGDRDGDVVKDEENFFVGKNAVKIEWFFFFLYEISGVPYSHKKSIIYLSVGRGVSRATTRNAPLSLFSSYFQPRHGSLYPLPSSLHLRFV